MLSRNLPPVDTGRFSMVPRGDVPRSTFATQHTHKSTFRAGHLVPIHVEEVLPGDVHQGTVTIFARVNTLLFPLMDNLFLETFFFFVPNRLVWDNWVKQMGQRDSPADSISFTTPVLTSNAGGFAVSSIFDYFGLPLVGQVGGAATVSVNVLPLRGYNLIFNEWFRDENLDTPKPVLTTDGPETMAAGAYVLQPRRKKHDYFTSCLPFPVKGGTDITAQVSGLAAVYGIAYNQASTPAAVPGGYAQYGGLSTAGWAGAYTNFSTSIAARTDTAALGADPLIYADLSTAAGLAVGSMRLAAATQQLLEKDSRSGTRYTELLRAHFGVTPEDARLQRPEYIGGGKSLIETQAIPQTSATNLTGGSTPLGALGAQATVSDRHSYSYHATEHGFIIGIVNVEAEVTYQQGLHRMWTRATRYDYYWPAFANLGEQVVRNDEIYVVGTTAGTDAGVFGYQERWAEYRHRPSRISGMFRSTSAGNIDEWHLAEQFSSLPVLGTNFLLSQSRPVLERALAAGAAAIEMQILFDSVWNIKCTRCLPVYSVPGLERF